MKHVSLLALVVVAFSGCITSNSATTQDLADGHINATFSMPSQWFPNQITIDLSSTQSTNTNDYCMRVQDTTTITINGVAGTVVNAGAFYFDEDSCESPEFVVPFDPATGVAEIVIDDGSAQLHFKLVQDSTWQYQVTRCDAVKCTVYNDSSSDTVSPAGGNTSSP